MFTMYAIFLISAVTANKHEQAYNIGARSLALYRTGAPTYKFYQVHCCSVLLYSAAIYCKNPTSSVSTTTSVNTRKTVPTLKRRRSSDNQHHHDDSVRITHGQAAVPCTPLVLTVYFVTDQRDARRHSRSRNNFSVFFCNFVNVYSHAHVCYQYRHPSHV